MKFFLYNSSRQVNVNISEYLIDWHPASEVSKPQAQVKKFLYPYWKSHIVLEEFRIPKKLWRCDLINVTRKIAVEVSPKGSHSYNPFFHKGSRLNYAAAINRDLKKMKWLEDNGFTYIEIFNEDLDILSPEWFQEKYKVTL